MTWTEAAAATYRAIAAVAVPRRRDMTMAVVDAAPFAAEQAIRILDLGAGDGALAEALLTRFGRATLTALDGSSSMRDAALSRLHPFRERMSVAAFDLASLDWWDRMLGAHLVVSSLAVHRLSDARKQYFYKAAADRLARGGALLIADLVDPQHAAARTAAADRWDALAREQAAALGAPELFARFEQERWNHLRFPDESEHPSALLHHLVWLRHAGFAAVDCLWMDAGHAVFGAFKPTAASAPPLRAGS